MGQNELSKEELEARIKTLELENAQLKDKVTDIEKVVNDSIQRYRDLFENLVDEVHVWSLVKDKNGKIITWRLVDANPSALKAWGKTKKEVIGKTTHEIFDYKAEEDFLPIVENIFETGEPYSWEVFFPPTNQYLSMTSVPFSDYFISTGRDVTPRKKIEVEKFEQQKEFQTWIQNTPVCTKKIDLNFNLQFMSEAGVRELKVNDVNKLYGAPYPFNFFPESFQKKMSETMKKVKETGEMAQIDGILADTEGNTMWYNHIIVPVYDDDQKLDYLLIISSDISDRKRAEHELKDKNQEYESINKELIEAKRKVEESEQRLKLASLSAELGIWDLDIENNVLLWDDRMYELYGIEKDNGTNTIDLWINGLHPEDKEQAISEFNKAVDGLKHFNTNFRVVRPNGEVVHIKGDGIVVRNPNGKALRMIGINRDVTESKLKEIELKTAKENAERANRLKTEFLNNLSHEIRTPMNGIIGFSRLFDKKNITEEKRETYARIVQNSSHQLLKTIDDILEISYLETKQIKVKEDKINLNDLLLELFAIFDLKCKERNLPFYLKKTLHNDKSFIIADKTKLSIVLSNLLENALKFTNEGFIELGYKIEKQTLILYVKDTGIGISKEKHSDIFERFLQEDKDVSFRHGGLGLGLSISKENVNLLGGDISVESEKGVGSTFYVTIPYKPA
jgi:PAS domain S-box-containing protein